MTFAAWLGAPFLKELTGKQLYDVMLAIKEGGVTGECECYVENGNAFVLHFLGGQPTSDKAKIAEILKRKSIVCAWMPGKTAGQAKPDGFAAVRAAVEQVVADAGVFTGADHWLVLLDKTEAVFSQGTGDGSGANLATALVAQINGSFQEIIGNRPLQRFSLDCGGDRFGFESLGGSYSVLSRYTSARQPAVRASNNNLRQALAGQAAKAGSFLMTSNAAEKHEAKYCLVRPQAYAKIEAGFRDWANALSEPWDCIWFQYDSDVTYSAERKGEGQQQKGGAFAELNTLIRQGFERLTGTPAINFVLYADAMTLWCDFFATGFWATRFADDKTGYRRVAEDAAKRGWALAEQAFARKKN